MWLWLHSDNSLFHISNSSSHGTDLFLLVSDFGPVQFIDEHFVLDCDTDVPCWSQVTTCEQRCPY